MLQIKTIQDTNPEHFDFLVNKALEDGWTLARRLTGPNDFIAEMEREVITEAEKCCENCRHLNTSPEKEPCASCSDDGDKWEAAE